MPNRIIRDALLDSERYHELTSNDARLLFIEMVLLADDYGLLPASMTFLSRRTTAVAGASAASITKLLSELADADLVRVYLVGTQRYAFIPRFGNYPRAKKPKWPIPPDELGGNEIKDLQRKRSANALPLHSNGSANAPETETETETETVLPPTSPSERLSPKGKRKPVGLELLLKAGVEEQMALDWLSLRRVKKLPLTATAMRGIEEQAQLAKLTVAQVVKEAIDHGWGSFKAVWLERDALDRNGRPVPQAPDSKASHDATQQYLKSLEQTPEERAKSEEARQRAMSAIRRVA